MPAGWDASVMDGEMHKKWKFGKKQNQIFTRGRVIVQREYVQCAIVSATQLPHNGCNSKLLPAHRRPRWPGANKATRPCRALSYARASLVREREVWKPPSPEQGITGYTSRWLPQAVATGGLNVRETVYGKSTITAAMLWRSDTFPKTRKLVRESKLLFYRIIILRTYIHFFWDIRQSYVRTSRCLENCFL